jgi:hypothetical protein
MASHFRFEWQARQLATQGDLFLAMIGPLAISCFVTFLVPWIVAALPSNLKNLPHREYWLSSDQRESTIRFLRVQMGWLACGVLFLLLYVTSETLRANLSPGQRLDYRGLLVCFGGFLAFVVFWLVRLLRHFCRLPEGVEAPRNGTF